MPGTRASDSDRLMPSWRVAQRRTVDHVDRGRRVEGRLRRAQAGVTTTCPSVPSLPAYRWRAAAPRRAGPAAPALRPASSVSSSAQEHQDAPRRPRPRRPPRPTRARLRCRTRAGRRRTALGDRRRPRAGCRRCISSSKRLKKSSAIERATPSIRRWPDLRDLAADLRVHRVRQLAAACRPGTSCTLAVPLPKPAGAALPLEGQRVAFGRLHVAQGDLAGELGRHRADLDRHADVVLVVAGGSTLSQPGMQALSTSGSFRPSQACCCGDRQRAAALHVHRSFFLRSCQVRSTAASEAARS